MAPHGYEPNELISAIWSGTAAMAKNDGTQTNENAFWNDFALHYGEQAKNDIPIFEEFYGNEFKQAGEFCEDNPLIPETVKALKEMGLTLVLACNPIFPSCATVIRAQWAKINLDDFVLVSNYEDFSYGKPNVEYYKEVLRRIDATPSECIMVGNDVDDDMAARDIGMNVFLLTDFLINKHDKDISVYPNGNFADLLKYIKSNI